MCFYHGCFTCRGFAVISYVGIVVWEECESFRLFHHEDGGISFEIVGAQLHGITCQEKSERWLNPGRNMAAESAVIRGTAISAMLADVSRNMVEVDPKDVVTANTF